jgi:SnoaL-like domain
MTDTTATDHTHLETIVDRYVDTWNVADAELRLELCRRVWTDDGRYVDPIFDARGPAAIADSLGAFQAQFPGHRVTRTTAIDTHHDLARFAWAVTAPDGTEVFAGVDVVAVAENGRFRSMTGFLGDLPARVAA